VRDRFPRSWRVALAVLMVPAGVLLAVVVDSSTGAAAATAANITTGASGPTGPTGPATTTTTTTTTTSSSTKSSTSSTTSTATTPAVPVSECVGDLAPATPTSTDPHLLNYTFHCDGQVSAFTIIVSRPGQAYDEIDDFNVAANVVNPTTGVQSTTETFNCQGAIPGSGINCLTATAGTSSDPWSHIEGDFDTTTPFCPTLPAHAKPGTKPSQGAVAYFVVSDPTGEQEGPWLFQMSPKCPAVKAVPKPKPKKK
jgi:hypothetical protein